MNTFLRKIEVERLVLDIVNRQFDESLHGLTSGAISDWARRAQPSAELIADLTKVGDTISGMCERSGERMDSSNREKLGYVRRLVRTFEERHRTDAEDGLKTRVSR